MSKEWKCTDCVKYKTDACSTCACGYTPTVSCRDVLVDFDYAYQQGRVDAIEEFLELIEKRITESNHGLYLIDAMSFAEQLKEQKNETEN